MQMNISEQLYNYLVLYAAIFQYFGKKMAPDCPSLQHIYKYKVMFFKNSTKTCQLAFGNVV